MLLLFYAYRSLLAGARANLISVLSVALFVAGGSLGLSYYLSLRGMVTTAPPENVIVVSKGSLAERESKLKLETARKIILLEGIRKEGKAPLAARELVSRLYMSSGEEPGLIRGIDTLSMHVHQAKVIRGVAPKPGTLEIMVGKRLAESFPHLKIGTNMALPGGPCPIVGIFEAGGSLLEDEIWTERSALELHLNVRNTSSVTFVAENVVDVPDLIERINTSRDLDAQAATVAEFRSDRAGLGSIANVVLALLILLSAVATFAITTTMSAAVARRMPELASLALIGIQRGVLGRIVLFESTLLGMLGALLGAGAGAALASQAGKIPIGNNPVEMTVSPIVVGVGVALGVAVGFVGGIGPAIRVQRLDIMKAVR